MEKKYCPPLDPALFTAIVSDYDLSNGDNVQQLRDTLEQLKISATEQEHLIFDPSATSGGTNPLSDADGCVSDPSPSQNGTQQSLETDITSLESNLSSLDLEYNERAWGEDDLGRGSERTRDSPATNAHQFGGFARMSTEDKTTYLKEMFSSVDLYTITHTLKKCGEDVDRSMDVLLNIAFFESQSAEDNDEIVSIPKGIEGFTAGSNTGRGRKKGKNKRNMTQQQRLRPASSSRSSSQSDAAVSENKWAKGKKDVDYICSRTSLSNKVVSSTYHLNGASLPATIQSFASTEAGKVTDDVMEQPVMVTQIAELSQDFSTIPPAKLAGLLILSRNSISAAKELAEVMVFNPVLLSPNITPTTRTNPRVIDTPIRRTPNPTPASARSPIMDYSTARNIVDSHMVAGQSAFNKASAAYRRGKSDHLMGGVAGYYSSVGRDHIEKAKKESAAAADILVNSQSTSRTLDLHGVSVQDAVRIASIKVSAWWESLGDSKYVLGGANTAREGYHIITGAGRHSRDGTSRLGPAVARRLAREGWKVEVGQGTLSVTGMARHNN